MARKDIALFQETEIFGRGSEMGNSEVSYQLRHAEVAFESVGIWFKWAAVVEDDSCP